MPLEALFARPDYRPTPEEDAALAEQVGEIRTALALLSVKERDALLLVSAAGLQSKQAASVLGISESALKMRVSRARNHLRQTLELHYESI